MINLIQEENILDRILGNLFPPKMESFDLDEEYYNRLNRTDIEPKIDYTKPYEMQFVAAARVEGSAQERRIIHLKGRTV